MELTTKQKEGLEIALDRFNNNKRYTIISGYAGTGKSTLVKYIIAALPGIDPDKDVVYTSFTGKATQVLAKKGNKNTRTLHKLLFKFRPLPNGGYVRVPVDIIPYKVVVVDEISMAPRSLIEQLATYPVYVIGLGDPFQLPPIDKNEDNHLLDSPHIFLDEIMRQAAESEIIQLTMKIRNGEKIEPFKGKEVQVLTKDELNTGMLTWADQILVATNNMRVAINNQMRDLLGHGDLPEDGDKVICCRNYWETLSTEKNSLTNGTIGYLHNSFESFISLPAILAGKNIKIPILNAEFIDDCDESYGNLIMDKQLILTGEKSIEWPIQYKMMRASKFKDLIPYEFLYAYAITCHKAQGSEWEKVLVLEEKFPFSKEEHARWLYTACTRASEKLVLILAD